MLPHQVRHLILQHCDQDTLTRLALVDRVFQSLVQLELEHEPTLCSSAAVKRYTGSTTAPVARSHSTKLVLQSTIHQREAAPPSRRKLKQQDNAVNQDDPGDAITEDDARQIFECMSQLRQLHLCQLHFTSLRRRTLSALTAHAFTLQHLSISGPQAPVHGNSNASSFNLGTIGRIVATCVNLRHLHLRNVKSSGPTLDNLGPIPSCALESFALISSPTIKKKDLSWLLRSTCLAESLRDLALEWNGSPRPVLEAVRYGILRVERLAFTSTAQGAVESLMLHCPSLLHLQMSVNAPVDPIRLLTNVERPLLSLEDHSPLGQGVNVQRLAVALESRHLPFARTIRHIAVCTVDVPQRYISILQQACSAQGTALVQLNPHEHFEPLIPPRYAKLHNVDAKGS